MSYPDPLTLAVNAQVSAEQRLAALTLELEAEKAMSARLLAALKGITGAMRSPTRWYGDEDIYYSLARNAAMGAIDAAEGRKV